MPRLPRVVVAGTHSGCGKTTVALALMAALSKSGETVQGFKAGPDYIDPGHHTAVTGRPSRNLDSWLMPPAAMAWSFQKGMAGASVGVVEGVMGLFDGLGQGETASTAEVAKGLNAPVILVVDAGGMSRSAAALARGFRDFDPAVRLAGVILNGVSGQGHAALVRESLKAVGIPLLGCLERDPDLRVPERHLGLITSSEPAPWTALYGRLGERAARSFDLAKILRIARAAPRLRGVGDVLPPRIKKAVVRIGVARDAAFSFYYADNLDLLEWFGAEIVPFSPLKDRRLPDASGLYLGGGFPELFSAELEANAPLRRTLYRKLFKEGMPGYAECGGLMYLSRGIIDGNGRRRAMVGAVPGWVRMTDRLQNFGYCEAVARQKTLLADIGDRFRGHQFHHSHWSPPASAAHDVTGSDERTRREGYARGALLASYVHLHFLSRPEAASRFVRTAASFARGAPARLIT